MSIIEVPKSDDIGRRNAVPIIYTRGTHYEIGFDIVRTQLLRQWEIAIIDLFEACEDFLSFLSIFCSLLGENYRVYSFCISVMFNPKNYWKNDEDSFHLQFRNND